MLYFDYKTSIKKGGAFSLDTYRPEQAWIDGTNFDAQKLFGARAEPNGVSFSVWAPNARSVRVTGDFCSWSDGVHWLCRDDFGVWRGFVPGRVRGTAL